MTNKGQNNHGNCLRKNLKVWAGRVSLGRRRTRWSDGAALELCRESNPRSSLELRRSLGVEPCKPSSLIWARTWEAFIFSVKAIVSCCQNLLAGPNGYPITARYPTRFSSSGNQKYLV